MADPKGNEKQGAAAAAPQLKSFKNVKTSVREGKKSIDGQAHALSALAPQFVLNENTEAAFTAAIRDFFSIASVIAGGQNIEVVGKGGTVRQIKPRRDCEDGKVVVLSSVDYPTDYVSLAKAINAAIEMAVKEETKNAAAKFQKTDEETDSLDNLV